MRTCDSTGLGWRGGSRSFLPQSLGTGWDLTFPTTWLLAGALTLSSAAWAGARAFQGARTFANAQGACARDCLLRRVQLGRLGAPGSLRGPPGCTGPPATPDLPQSLAWGGRTVQRWVSRVGGPSEVGWWACAACNAARPVHRRGQGVQNVGVPRGQVIGKSRAVTAMADVGPGVRMAPVQVPPLPLPGRGISGSWFCFLVPQFPHLQNGDENSHLEGLL